MRFLLVHSRLVGPTTWRWVADALEAAGHDVTVPDLRPAALSGRPEAVITSAVASTSRDPAVVVGHSGAGVLLPAIALDPAARGMIFVDALVPPCEGEATASGEYLDLLRALPTIGDRLPKWSIWWGAGVMETLVPDRHRRALIEEEMPELPLAYHEAPVVLPAGWCQASSAYLLLSEVYRPHADHARSLGWQVRERLGKHLDIVNDPEPIAHQLVELVGRWVSDGP